MAPDYIFNLLASLF